MPNSVSHQKEVHELEHLMHLTIHKKTEEIKAYLVGLHREIKDKVLEVYMRELYDGNGFIAIRKTKDTAERSNILLFDVDNPEQIVSIVEVSSAMHPITIEETLEALKNMEQLDSHCHQYKLISLDGFISDEEDDFKTIQKYFNLSLHDWSHLEELIHAYNPNHAPSQHINLHAHNKIAYENMLVEWKKANRVAIIQATGTGKSFLIAKCIADFAEKKKIVLAPSSYILKQLMNKFPWLLKNTIFMTYQKAIFLTEEEIEALDLSLIVLDEFHRIGAKKWGRAIERIVQVYPNAEIIGTSATPIRYLDGSRDISDEFFENNVASNLSLSEAIAQKILPTPKYISAIYTLAEEMKRMKEKIKTSEHSETEKEAFLEKLNELSLKWENTSGIEEVLNKHIVDENKFIVFCENKDHLEQMEQLVASWFEKALKKPIETYKIVYGNKENDRNLNAFIHGKNKQHVHLLLSIDMLNEGMHIQDVDGVVLLRKTTSPNIFYQQIGRSMDTSKKKHPLIFDFVNNFSNIKANDFLDDLEAAKKKLNEIREAFGLPKIKLELDVLIVDETMDAQMLFAKLEHGLLNTWDIRWQELMEYKQVNGDCLVPTHYKPNKKLATWVVKQRQYLKEGRLTKEKFEKLNEIDFVWDVLDFKWEQMFNALCQFKYTHGHCLISTNDQENKELCHWVVNQRHDYKKERLAKEKIDKLNQIGFVWDARDFKWEEMFRELCDYKKKHGDCFVPKKYEPNKELGFWVTAQRQFLKKGSLSKEKINRLNEIDFVWDVLDFKWNQLFLQLCEYKALHGDCLVPKQYKPNKELGNWVSAQRHYFKNGQLPQERIDKLNQIDFVWEVKR